ncbi:hypothetical protein KAK07_22850 [Ideonella sp. 4Y16]|uniref:Secreted protein n=1 Tax=Ideonella aquatica TaxID=2824119 RepID=A0A940YM20_9BURK|nr:MULTISPECIES: hypothetical protein [Ideonella]MBQ0946197.1 hypothetical protein [Ideonella alba]MBQ0960379.1 hypothetical protein [Ideonella aquatica]
MRTATILRASAALIVSTMLGTAMAGDIRKTPLPDPATSIKQFGYSATQNSSLLNSASSLWAQVPPASWTANTYTLRSKMALALGSTGVDTALANVIINVCKVYARDPQHCVIYTTAVACAESSCGDPSLAPAIQNNIFGLHSGQMSYSSRTEAVKYWITKGYNSTWYTANEGYFYGYCAQTYFCARGVDYSTYFFYSNVVNMPPTSHYCMSEAGSNISGYCPKGYNNSSLAYYRVR